MEKIYFKRRSKWPLIILSLLVAYFCVMTLSINIGSTNISLAQVFGIFIKETPLTSVLPTQPPKVDEVTEIIILQVRIPRIIAATFVGMALATAGTVFQGIFRNPMADPYIIGASSGAALGAALAIVLGLAYSFLGASAIPSLAFIMGLIAVLIVYSISRVGSRIPVTTLLLSGIVVSIFLSAIVSFLSVIAGEKLHAIVFWLMGSFSYTVWDDVKTILPFIFVGVTIIYLFARDLNIMQLSEEEAQHLGVEVERAKKTLLIFASLITAAAVSVSGLIGFVGLIIPHMVRILVGPDHRVLIPSALITGAMFLVSCDTIARVIFPPVELPVGIITAFSGGPFFVYLLRKRGRKYGL